MKIMKNSRDRLVLEDRPWTLGIILAVVVMIFLLIAVLTVAENLWLGLGMGLGAAMFGLFFVFFVRRVIVIFDRGAGAVVIRSVSLLGQKEQTLALADLRGVLVETIVSTNTGSSTGGRVRSATSTHRPSLQTVQGLVPLTEVYAGGDGAKTAADAINDWLQGAR